jgi:hypothetical protein
MTSKRLELEKRVRVARQYWHRARKSGDEIAIRKARKIVREEEKEAKAEHRRDWVRRCAEARK